MEDWKDEVTAALEQLDVADTLEELRHHIDALIDRLSDSRQQGENAATSPGNSPELDTQLETLGRKVEAASSMLAAVGDLLESQSERLETIERQIGDPDAASSTASASPDDAVSQAAELARVLADLRAEVDGFAQQRGWLDARLERLEASVERLDASIERLVDGVATREHRLQEVEDRLLVFFETQATITTAAPGAQEIPSTPVKTEPATRVAPKPDLDGPLDAATARRLESLVEREIKLQHQFAPGAERTSEVARTAARPTVMVVDDSVDARTVLSIYLSRTGYHVVTAASAEDCLAKLRHHAIDAVILDATMPGGGGEHFLRVLHSDASYGDRARIPVIVYTAHPESLSRERARQLGATDYLIKGGDLLPLLTMLMHHLQGGVALPHSEAGNVSELKRT